MKEVLGKFQVGSNRLFGNPNADDKKELGDMLQAYETGQHRF